VDEGCAGSTTTGSPATEIACFLGGFVAAEGCFTRDPGGLRYRFSIGLGAVDEGTCAAFASFWGCGWVRRYRRRKAHYDDEVVFVVQSKRELVGVVVPFMDAHLPVSYKRTQYLAWRAELLDTWEHRSRRPRR
jgi:LAGLIDADG endonuclease